MRSIFLLGLLLGLCVPASAATRHHTRVHGPDFHAVIRSGQDGVVPPGWYKFPGRPPIPPEENRNLDPSNFGGG